MKEIPIIRRVNNMEIISKLLNSVAKRCDCRITYNPTEGLLVFSGDTAYQKYITEKAISFFHPLCE
jgi:hypothetical protein